MDDLGAAFFDLPSSSASYSLGSGSTLSSNNFGAASSISPISTMNNSKNVLQDQVMDFDSLLFSGTSYSSFDGHSSLQTSGIKQELTANHELSTNASQSYEMNSLNTYNDTSLDFMLEHTSYAEVRKEITEEDLTNTSDSHVSVTTTEKPVNFAVMDSNMIKVTLSKPLTIKTIPCSLSTVAASSHQTTSVSHVATISNMLENKSNIVKVEPDSAHLKIRNDAELKNRHPMRNLTDPTNLRIIVCNVVASFRVRCHLNLRQIAMESIDVVYKRESQKVVMRMRKPRCTAYIWSSGKIVCTGSSSAENAKEAARKFAKRLKRVGFKVRFAEFKVVNVLAVSKMPFAININDFSQAHKGKHCSYEPELHPGVTYRDAASKATLKIFSTGSVTVTARSVSRAKEGIRNLFPSFKPFYRFEKPNLDFNYEDALPSDNEDLS
ncbi:unnamed protein product [Clavelina lepadiformis]|uniref:TATA box-binding protein-like 1 n=1 Tax=Clavelina lepadiformis TaxID=159417 RepID=A0ABP0H4I8_CLALP